MKEDIVLIGGGGHCKSCIDVIESTQKFKIAGIIDNKNLHSRVLGYPILGTDADMPMIAKEYRNFLISIGQIKSSGKRRVLFEKLKEIGANFPVVISQNAYVSSHANIREGTIVMHHALINSGATIGKNCIINSKALVEHDAHIGDHCHISTSAVINGGVKIGCDTFIGSRVMTREYIEIGEKSFVGGGLTIIKNIQNNSFIKPTL